MELARVFHGVTAPRLAVLAGFGVVFSLFNYPVALSYARGLSTTHVLLAFVQTYLGAAIWFTAGLLAGVATYNGTRGRPLVRAAAALAAIGIVVWLVQPLSLGVRNASWRDVFAHTLKPSSIWLANLALAALAVAALLYLAGSDEVGHSLEVEARRALDLSRGLDEARLQATQAQIEPHFLFNTLANIRRLYEVDPEAARTMLGQFTRMLGQTLPDIRTERSTLAREVGFAVAYLNVQKIRMGQRLDFTTQIPPHLHDAALPPMMLSTLVENAIKHGLAPLPAGGRVTIRAHEERGALRVCVVDTGRGLCESTGVGVGLANIQTRLAALFGEAGILDLEANERGGLTASLALPLTMEPAEAAHAGAAG